MAPSHPPNLQKMKNKDNWKVEFGDLREGEEKPVQRKADKAGDLYLQTDLSFYERIGLCVVGDA